MSETTASSDHCPFCEAEGLDGPPCRQIDSDPDWLKEQYHQSERIQRLQTEALYGKENVHHFSGGSGVKNHGVFLYGLVRRPVGSP